MRILRALLKPLSFLPALCLMYMIFSFSAQDGATSSQLSYKVSYTIVETGGKILGENWEPWPFCSRPFPFRQVPYRGSLSSSASLSRLSWISGLQGLNWLYRLPFRFMYMDCAASG